MHGQPSVRRRNSVVLLLMLLVPLIAACRSETATPNTAITPVASTLPTTVEQPTTAAATTAPTAPAATTPAETITINPVETMTAVAEASATAEQPAETATTVASADATAIAAPTTTVSGTAESVDRPQFGVVTHLYYTDRARVLQLAENAGFDWVRQQVPWKDTEKSDRTFGWDELDQIVESVSGQNRKLLLSIAKSPDFLTERPGDNGLPRDPKDFARFAEAIVERYKGKVQAIEVWNEQNLAVENGGEVVPEGASRYVEMLKEAYTRIKAVDPNVIVVAGALSSTGVTEPAIAVDDMTYLKAMYDYNDGEVKNYFDVQGFHPASAANPPDTKYPDDIGNVPGWNDHPTHFFRHIEDVRAAMVDAGVGDKKIWITEMGWATKNNSPGYEYGEYVSFDQQALYLEGALFRTVFQYSDWVGAVFVWNLNFAVLWGEQGNPEHEQAAFGLLNPDWTPRPSFTRVQGFINAVKSTDQP